MALTLDATAKGASANSYVTRAEADAYFDGRVNAAEWTASTVTAATKEQALVAATDRLEQEQYLGYKTTTTQRLKWPRTNVYDDDGTAYAEGVSPRPMKEACYEQALALLKDAKLLDATGLAAFDAVAVGPLNVQIRQPEASGKLPAQVQRLLRGLWIGGSGIVRLVRA